MVAAREWTSDAAHMALLNPLERRFLAESITREANARLAARRRTRLLYGLVAALAALTVVAGSLSFYALSQRGDAVHQRDLAVSRQVAISANDLRRKDAALAEQLAPVAYQIAPTPEARASVLESFSAPTVTRFVDPGHNNQMVAVNRTGELMAAVSQEAMIRLWRLTGPRSVPLGAPRGAPPEPSTPSPSTRSANSWRQRGPTSTSTSGASAIRPVRHRSVRRWADSATPSSRSPIPRRFTTFSSLIVVNV